MRRKNDTPTRGEVSEKVETSKEKMQEGIESLEVIVEDTETIRGTLENIEGGTSEGTESVLSAITEAEDVSVTKFGEEDSVLEEAQDQAERYETEEIQERKDTVQSDIEKISEAASKIETKEATTEMEKATDAASEDITFLTEQAEISKAARAENESLQQQARSRVQSGKK